MAQLKSGSTVGGDNVLLDVADSVGASNIAANAVGSSEIADNAITLAKMAHGTDGEIITYDASGAPATVAVGSSGQVLTSNGTGAAPSMQDAAGGNAVLQPFTVATGKSVSTAEVMNLSGGEIGANPVVNTATTTITEGSDSFTAVNEIGTVGIRAYKNGSGYHCVETYLISDGAITSQGETVVYTGNTGAGTSIVKIDDDKFVMYGLYINNYRDPTYYYAIKFEVNPTTGGVTVGTVKTWTASDNYTDGNVLNIYNLDSSISGAVGMYRRAHHYSGSNTYWYETFPVAGLTISTQSTNSIVTQYSNSLLVNSNTKLIAPTSGATWNQCDWNGTDVSNGTTISTGYTTGSATPFIHRIPSTDTFVFAYINTSTQLMLETYEYSSGNLNKVASSALVVIDDASGVTIGGITGTSTGVVLTYENGSKGYADSFSLDGSYKVNGSGISLLSNSTNYAPNIQYSGASDLYRIWWNEATANARKLTVNAYATSALIPIGISSEAGTGGEVINTVVDGIASGFTGLTVDAPYYYDTSLYDGSITTTNTGTLVGRAISTTELKVML